MNQCCGSGMFILDPDFLPIPDPRFRISDPGSKNSNKREGWKKICCTFILKPQISQNCKLFHFINVEEKNLANFKKILDFFTQKIVTKVSRIWVRDPGSGKKPVPNPGSRGEKGTGSRILDPQYWKQWKQPTNFIGTKINHHSLWHFLLIPCSENLSFKSSKASDERNNICKCICWKCNPF